MTAGNSDYKKVLVAVDLSEPCEKLSNRVKSFMSEGSEVHLCSAVIPLELMYSFVPIGGYSVAIGGFQDEIVENAQKGLEVLAKELGLEKDKAHLLMGKASTEIKLFAEENNFELIIIGTHGKSAVRSALGSTSNGVLHGAPCDVLAIRI